MTEADQVARYKFVFEDGRFVRHFHVTGPVLKQLFADRRIVRTGKPPEDATFSFLARRIEAFERVSHHLRHSWKQSLERTRQAHEAARTLTDLLPAMMGEFKGGGPSPAAMRDAVFFQPHAADIATLLTVLPPLQAQLSQYREIETRLYGEAGRWHDYVFDLTEAFRGAMRIADPGFKGNLSNEGVVGRFLAAVIPLISGENPKATAIIRYMTRRQPAEPSAPSPTVAEGQG